MEWMVESANILSTLGKRYKMATAEYTIFELKHPT